MGMTAPLKVGDAVSIRQKGAFVVLDGDLRYIQPPDEVVTIQSEEELERMKQMAGKLAAE